MVVKYTVQLIFVSMKLISLKCIFTISIAFILFLKVSGSLSLIQFSAFESTYTSASDDTAEKEEKKVETEYFTDQLPEGLRLEASFIIGKKVVVPEHSFKLNYFPEVLTPPPSA